MPLILGIDSSLTGTGLCRIEIDDVDHSRYAIEVHTVRTAGPKTKTRREYSRRITHVVKTVAAAMEGVDVIMMEELAYGAKGATAFVLPWLWGRIIDEAEQRDIPLAFSNIQQLKKYATGSGASDKTQVMARMIRAFPSVNITNDNESDAMVLALMGARGWGYPLDHPTQAKAEVMEKIGALTK